MTDLLLLPERPKRFGPVTRRLLGRFVAVMLMVEIVGAALVFVADDPVARAAGLSLVFPGGGFLYAASPVLFVATQVLVVVALVLWWGLSTHFSIPAVWALGVIGSVLLADGPRVWVDRGTHWDWAVPVVYAAALVTLGVMVWKVERRFRAKRARVPEINSYLRDAAVPDRVTELRAPDAMDAELLRWCYSFADQPDDGLAGLDWGEQFHGGTQLRYQLNSVAWSMALYAANYLPNAPRRIEQALGRVVAKHTDPRVWGYWRTLNLLGNFDPNPDPIRRDNIMFSAFLGDVINSFEAATGSSRFDEAGSLTFVWRDGRTFAYDHHSIVAAVRANYDRSRLGFFPCEPGWSFTVCNVMGAQALHGHDTLHGTDEWDQVRERWRQTLDEEYLTPDGSYAHIRSNHVGLSWDTGEVPGGHYFANGTHRFVDILPDHARRAKALDLRGASGKMAALSSMIRDGRLELELPEEPERHRTRSSALLPWNKVIGGARMVGDAALTRAAVEASARQCATGERWPGRPLAVGGAGIGSHMLLRWSAPLDLAALNMRGYLAPVGPVVDEADDRVLVTLARCDDGVRLDLMLEPYGEAVHDAVLAVSGLAPSTTARIHGDGIDLSVVAAPDGSARVVVPLVDRPVRLVVEAAS
ncbi:MAG: hypothetical protein RI958_2488 [Actinomycetota bacterium]